MVSDAQKAREEFSSRLNPCCNGIWSQTCGKLKVCPVFLVLILVVMEYGLRLTHNPYAPTILCCLNPCCNGIWSQSANIKPKHMNNVLILVVMEYGLRPYFKYYHVTYVVLILVVMEYGLRLLGRNK